MNGDGQPSVGTRVLGGSRYDEKLQKHNSQCSVEHTAAVASKCQSMADPCVRIGVSMSYGQNQMELNKVDRVVCIGPAGGGGWQVDETRDSHGMV